MFRRRLSSAIRPSGSIFSSALAHPSSSAVLLLSSIRQCSGGRIKSIDEDEVEDEEDVMEVAPSPAARRAAAGSGFFSFDDEDRINDVDSEWLDTQSNGSSPASAAAAANKQNGDAQSGAGEQYDADDDDLILDGGARSILMQELDEKVNIPLTERILTVGREWINSGVSSVLSQYSAVRSSISREESLVDGALLQRSGFSSASAHLTHSGLLRIHYPLLVRNPARDLLPLCRVVARLHGSSLRQESFCREIKLQQTAMPYLGELLTDLAEQPSQNSSATTKGDAHEFVLVSSADVIDEKIAVVTVLAFDGRRSSLEPGTELAYTTVALRLFLSPKKSGLKHMVVPEPKYQ